MVLNLIFGVSSFSVHLRRKRLDSAWPIVKGPTLASAALAPTAEASGVHDTALPSIAPLPRHDRDHFQARAGAGEFGGPAKSRGRERSYLTPRPVRFNLCLRHCIPVNFGV